MFIIHYCVRTTVCVLLLHVLLAVALDWLLVGCSRRLGSNWLIVHTVGFLLHDRCMELFVRCSFAELVVLTDARGSVVDDGRLGVSFWCWVPFVLTHSHGGVAMGRVVLAFLDVVVLVVCVAMALSVNEGNFWNLPSRYDGGRKATCRQVLFGTPPLQ